MGPVAGIGDTVMQGILFPILFGIGCSMALEGSYLGPILSFVIFEALIFGCGYFMFMTGYKHGKTSLLKILKNGTIDKIINAFSIVGLMVVGSMAATRVAVNTPLAIHVGEGTTEFQSVTGFTGTRTHSAWNYHAGMVDAEEESKYPLDYFGNLCSWYSWILYRYSWICRIIKEKKGNG